MEWLDRRILAIGAFSMAMAVILGALGAHALENLLDPDRLESFKTGVRYQAWHSLALLILGIWGRRITNQKSLRLLVALFGLGTVFFSFSIYLLSTGEILGIESWSSMLGPITPLGGSLLIAAWVLLGIKTLQGNESSEPY